MTEDERRKGEEPVPGNPSKFLNVAQMNALRQLERFGWRLAFVRRPLFQKVVPVVIGPDNQEIGILEEDGRINMEPDIQVRDKKS